MRVRDYRKLHIGEDFRQSQNRRACVEQNSVALLDEFESLFCNLLLCGAMLFEALLKREVNRSLFDAQRAAVRADKLVLGIEKLQVAADCFVGDVELLCQFDCSQARLGFEH